MNTSVPLPSSSPGFFPSSLCLRSAATSVMLRVCFPEASRSCSLMSSILHEPSHTLKASMVPKHMMTLETLQPPLAPILSQLRGRYDDAGVCCMFRDQDGERAARHDAVMANRRRRRHEVGLEPLDAAAHGEVVRRAQVRRGAAAGRFKGDADMGGDSGHIQ